MKRLRLFVPQALTPGATLTLDREQAHYLGRVMRASAGDTIVLFNGEGGEYVARLTACDGRQAACRIEAFCDIDRELPLPVHIVQAASRPEKIETVLQKGAELGAASFQIVRTRRAQLKLAGERLGRRLDRWRKIAIEAAEQSGRTRLPTVNWRERLEDAELPGLRLTLHPEAAAEWRAMRPRIETARAISLVIGPEGGFSTEDLETLDALGCVRLSFGPRILRTETAAPALLAAVQAVLPAR